MLTTFLVIACQYINVCINDSLDISNLVREIARENTLSSVAEKMLWYKCFIIIPRMALAWLDAGLFYFTRLSEDSFCVWLHLSRQLHPRHVGLNQQVCLYVRVIVFGVRHFVRHTVHELQYKQGIWLLTLLEKPINNCIVPSLLPCSLKGRWKQ